MTKAGKIQTSFQGITVTPSYLTVHFAVGNGGWLRHAAIKVPMTELLTDEVTQALDTHVRRRMIEIWSQEPVPDLFDEERTARAGFHLSGCTRPDTHEGSCATP